MISPEQLGRYADVVTTVGPRMAVDRSAGALQPKPERAAG
jgi:hypothetical protein